MRIFSFIVFVSCMLFIFRPAPAQSEKKVVLSLDRCEELALQNNPLLKAAKLGLERSRVRKSQAASARILPKVELKNIWGPVPRARAVYTETGVLTSPDTATGLSDLRFFTEVDFNWVQPLYTFGKISGLNKAATYGVEADEANLERRKWDLRLVTRQLYWGILLGKEMLEVIEDTRKELDKAENKLNEMLDEGSTDVSENDLFKLQIFKYEINKKYREALRQKELAVTGLKATLGLDEHTPIELATEYLDPVEIQIDSLDRYIALALQNRPELHQLRAGLGASRAMVTVAKSDFYPQFFLAGGVKYNFAKDRDDPRNPWVYNPTNFFRPGILFGVKMNLNFVQVRQNVQLANVKYNELSYQESLLIQKIKMDVRKKYLELLEAQKNIEESERALKVSNNWLRSVSMTFDIGLTEVKELIDAYKANGTMKAEHLQNIFKFNTLVAELSKQVGYDLYKSSNVH